MRRFGGCPFLHDSPLRCESKVTTSPNIRRAASELDTSVDPENSIVVTSASRPPGRVLSGKGFALPFAPAS